MNFCRAQGSDSDSDGTLRLIATVVCRRFCDSFYLYAISLNYVTVTMSQTYYFTEKINCKFSDYFILLKEKRDGFIDKIYF